MAELLVDSDIFIDHLRGARHVPVGEDDSAAYSIVTLAELFAGARVDESAVRLLLAPFAILSVDRAIAERAGRIRRQSGTRIADAIIAATALERGLTLMTRNFRDFGNIPGLQLSGG